jgi:spore coat polysaccharide biosynthesis predicted glycosyltransferase SpsG
MGHIMRCLAFANGLNDLEGIESLFVTRALDSRVSDLVEAEGHRIEVLPANVTASEDAELVSEFAVTNGANLIVTDICHRVALENKEELEIYHRLLTDSYFTICFAGRDGHDLSANIVISPYVRTTYPPSVIENERTLLLGPSYFVFRPEFIEAAQVPRTIAKKGRRILVTVGGGGRTSFDHEDCRGYPRAS